MKCSEERPACIRCITSARICEGYDSKIDKRFKSSRETTALAPSAPFTLGGLGFPTFSTDEQLAFQFFLTHTAPQLSTAGESDFWAGFIVQVSKEYPAVRHAVLALGDAHLHSNVEQRSPTPDSDDGSTPNSAAESVSMREYSTELTTIATPFAIRQYNMAIRELTKLKSSLSLKDICLCLSTCLMFICIEVCPASTTANSSLTLVFRCCKSDQAQL